MPPIRTALRRLRVLLLRPRLPLWRHALLAFLLALLPTLALMFLTVGLLTLLGLDPQRWAPPSRGSGWGEFFGVVVLAPLIETPLLGLSLALLGRLIRRRTPLVLGAALLWGLLHMIDGGPLKLVGTAWSFAVFAALYRTWRPASFAHAYLAAGLPHALINLTTVLAAALFG